MFASSDNETGRLAERIYGILQAAGWSVPDRPSGGMFFGDRPLVGIQIAARSQTAAALALLNGLHRLLPDVQGQLAPTWNDDTIQITVFSKR